MNHPPQSSSAHSDGREWAPPGAVTSRPSHWVQGAPNSPQRFSQSLQSHSEEPPSHIEVMKNRTFYKSQICKLLINLNYNL